MFFFNLYLKNPDYYISHLLITLYYMKYCPNVKKNTRRLPFNPDRRENPCIVFFQNDTRFGMIAGNSFRIKPY